MSETEHPELFDEASAWKAAEEIKSDVDKRAKLQVEHKASVEARKEEERDDDKFTSGGYHQAGETQSPQTHHRAPSEVKGEVEERDTIIDGRIALVEDEEQQ